MSDDFGEYGDPRKWPWVIWPLVVFAAVPFGVMQTMIPDDDWGTPGHQVIVGIAVIELGLVYHLLAYPEIVAGVIAFAVGLGIWLWGLVPTIYWEPWWVSSSMLVVGVVPLANGLRAARGGDSA